jgi:hypothetical protein
MVKVEMGFEDFRPLMPGHGAGNPTFPKKFIFF